MGVNMGLWDVRIKNYNCPYKVGDSKTLLEPDYSDAVKCNYPNKRDRPSKCKKKLCPIIIHNRYCDWGKLNMSGVNNPEVNRRDLGNHKDIIFYDDGSAKIVVNVECKREIPNEITLTILSKEEMDRLEKILRQR